MQYDQQAICDLLNTLQRYDEVDQRGWNAGMRVEKCEFGDYVRLEDVAALFNLIADTYKSDLPVTKKILPND